MNMSHDILLVDDSQNEIGLAHYALRGENLANSIFVSRDVKKHWTYFFVAALLPKKVAVIDVALA